MDIEYTLTITGHLGPHPEIYTWIKDKNLQSGYNRHSGPNPDTYMDIGYKLSIWIQ